MCASRVIGFGEDAATATYADGLAFIERTRRQLDRFEEGLPHVPGRAIAPDAAAEIRRLCDELETSIRKDIGDI